MAFFRTGSTSSIVIVQYCIWNGSIITFTVDTSTKLSCTAFNAWISYICVETSDINSTTILGSTIISEIRITYKSIPTINTDSTTITSEFRTAFSSCSRVINEFGIQYFSIATIYFNSPTITSIIHIITYSRVFNESGIFYSSITTINTDSTTITSVCWTVSSSSVILEGTIVYNCVLTINTNSTTISSGVVLKITI